MYIIEVYPQNDLDGNVLQLLRQDQKRVSPWEELLLFALR